MQVAFDPDENFIVGPLVAWSGPTTAQAICNVLAGLATPASDALIRDYDTLLRQEQFNVAQAQLNTSYSQTAWLMISPRKRWRYRGVRWRLHFASLAATHARDPVAVTVTMPGHEVVDMV
jgi:hypothetical protein